MYENESGKLYKLRVFFTSLSIYILASLSSVHLIIFSCNIKCSRVHSYLRTSPLISFYDMHTATTLPPAFSSRQPSLPYSSSSSFSSSSSSLGMASKYPRRSPPPLDVASILPRLPDSHCVLQRAITSLLSFRCGLDSHLISL